MSDSDARARFLRHLTPLLPAEFAATATINPNAVGSWDHLILKPGDPPIPLAFRSGTVSVRELDRNVGIAFPFPKASKAAPAVRAIWAHLQSVRATLVWNQGAAERQAVRAAAERAETQRVKALTDLYMAVPAELRGAVEGLKFKLQPDGSAAVTFGLTVHNPFHLEALLEALVAGGFAPAPVRVGLSGPKGADPPRCVACVRENAEPDPTLHPVALRPVPPGVRFKCSACGHTFRAPAAEMEAKAS